MKIKMKTIYSGPRGMLQPKQVADIDEKTAKDLIKSGSAEKAHKDSPVTGFIADLEQPKSRHQEKATSTAPENAAEGDVGKKDGVESPKASKAAFALAEKAKIDLLKVAGTGSDGSITVNDVKAAIVTRDEAAASEGSDTED